MVSCNLFFYKKSIYMLRKTYNSANITQNGDVQPGLQTSPHLLREELTRPHQSEDDFQCIRQSPRKYIMFMYKLPRHFRGAYYNKKKEAPTPPTAHSSLTHTVLYWSPWQKIMVWGSSIWLWIIIAYARRRLCYTIISRSPLFLGANFLYTKK